MSEFTDRFHRTALLLLEQGDVKTIEEANIRLKEFTIHVHVGFKIQDSYVDQVALLTLVVLGVRTFLGGVFIVGNLNIPNLVRFVPGETLAQAVSNLGGSLETQPTSPAITIYLANAIESSRGVRLVYTGWIGGIVPARSAPFSHPTDSPLSAVLAAALAINEIFEYFNGKCAYAGLRTVMLSLWDLKSCSARRWDSYRAIECLPDSIWLLGLGHLGQAYAWLIGMMNYPKPRSVNLVLQDVDWVGESTFSTSVLSSDIDIGKRKTRVVSAWLENAGFDPRIIDQLFTKNQVLTEDDPRLCFVGVDKIPARHALTDIGFSTIIEAGLGGDAYTYSRINVHVLPGERSPDQIWSIDENEEPKQKKERFSQLAERNKFDKCGRAELDNVAVGAPFVGMVAACLVYSQSLRILHQGPYFDAIDITVGAIEHVNAHRFFTSGQIRNTGYQSLGLNKNQPL